MADGLKLSRRWRTALRALEWLMIAGVFVYMGVTVLRGAREVRTYGFVFNPWLLAVSGVVLFSHYMARALVWHYLTVRMASGIPLGPAVTSWFYSLLGKYVPGKVFLLLGRLYFYSRYGRSKVRVAFCFVLETVLTLLSSVVTVLASLLFVDTPELRRYRPALVVLMVLLAVAVHPRLLSRGLNLGLRLIKRPPVELGATYADMLVFTVLFTVTRILLGGAFYVFLASFCPVPLREAPYAVAAFSLANIIGILAVFAPSGLGVREGVLIFMIRQILPTSVASAVTLAARVWMTLGELLFVGAVFLVERSRLPSRREVEASGTETVGGNEG